MESISTVWNVAEKVINFYGKGELKDVSNDNLPHEAKLLMLDIAKAKFNLGWSPKMNINQTIALTVDWYKRYSNENVYDLCLEELKKYIAK